MFSAVIIRGREGHLVNLYADGVWRVHANRLDQQRGEGARHFKIYPYFLNEILFFSMKSSSSIVI